MSKIVSLYKTLRRNWKKTTLASILLAYGANSLKRNYEINIFMKACCKEAEQYGNQLLPVSSEPRTITVILNPAANKKHAKEEYEKYCEPLLHLAGISINLLQTNGAGHAKDLVATLPANESIVVAGGDGTLSEIVTGVLRQSHETNRVVGILPLGRTNQVGNNFFPLGDTLPKVKQLSLATMAVIKNNYELKDVMKIQVTASDEEHKPIFALGNLEWGAFRDAFAKRDKYWFYGSFKDYLTFVFNGYKNSLCWDCKGVMKTTPPCKGCSNCCTVVHKKQKSFRMLDLIMPKAKEEDLENHLSKVVNDNCGIVNVQQFKTVNLSLSLVSGDEANPSHISLNLSKPDIGYFEFISDGWKRLKKSNSPNIYITARTVEILPELENKDGTEVWYEIDNEEFDVKPIKISVVPKAINMYCIN